MLDLHDRLARGIRAYFKKFGFEKAVIGLSGGVDSALSLRLAVDALGNKDVMAVLMPEKGITNVKNVEDAENFCHLLRVEYKVVPINPYIDCLKNLPWKRSNIAMMNIKARARANILYDYANSHHALVIGTSNKSEILLGYGTKHGDIAADLFVIGDLYKTEVVNLSKFLGLPEYIVRKKPTAELYKGQTDEKELGASYAVLDDILMNIGNIRYLRKKYNKELISSVLKRISMSEHKRRAPMVILV